MSLLTRTAGLIVGEPMEAPEEIPPDTIPPGVKLRRGRLVPRIGGLLVRSLRPAAAVTLGRTIIVDPEARLTPELLEHELTHVRQWRANPLLFPIRYTLATLRHGYRDNPFEIEAREAARRYSSAMKG